MKFNKLFRFTILIAVATSVFACDDDVNSIGQSIQPDEDDIIIEVDEIYLEAETMPLTAAPFDKIYVETETPLLGDFQDPQDPIMSTFKAEYLAQLFTSGSTKFEDDKDAVAPIQIDSVLLNLSFLLNQYSGDTISPLVISAFEVNKPLEANYYTNIDPTKYCDKSILLGQRLFNMQSLPISVFGQDANSRNILGRIVKVELDKKMGVDLLEKWRKDPSVLSDFDNFKEYFKGVYITSDFKNKGMLEVMQTDVNIHYSYKIRKKDDSADSTVLRVMPLPVTNESIIMNSAKNSSDNNSSFLTDRQKTYVKAPGAVGTKITINLAEIRKKAIEKTKTEDYLINLARFKMVGMTEEEDKLTVKKRPASLLFVNLDSISALRFNQKKPLISDNVSAVVMKRDNNNNTYNFAIGNAYTTDGVSAPSAYATNNLASLISHYLKREEKIEKLEFLVIPIQSEETSSRGTNSITGISNLYSPASAILRTDKEYMKMSLIFSKHNTQQPVTKR